MQYVTRKKSLSPSEKTQRELEQQQHNKILRLKNNRLGIAIFQLSWIMIFVCLIVVYWQIGYQPGWRPTAELAPHALMPTFATIALIFSGWFARRALKIVESTNPETLQPSFFRDWWLAIGLGTFFFVAMMVQFFAVPTGAEDGEQFGLVYRVMIGYHAIHAIVIGLMMLRVWYLGRDGRFHRDNSWPVEGSAKLWYFVVGAWLMFYAVLYLPFLR